MVSVKAKLPSLALAAIALIASWHTPRLATTAPFSLIVVALAPIFVCLGLIAVWLGRPLGGYTGPVFRWGYVDSPTPEIAFVVFGYVVLALPIAALIFHVLYAATRTI
jgi:hypothetical protein